MFAAMFYGALAETANSIELPDCEYESLLELFRYMYSDEVILSGSNVMGLLYLATKYMVPSLTDKCIEYLQDNLDPSNVFSILPSAQKYEEKNLVDQCWKVIDKQTDKAVKSDAFATIERSLLEEVVVRDTLHITEVDLFKEVMQWATKESEKQGLVADGRVKRRILGEKIVKGIRFPVMTLDEFASVVLDSRILTLGEVSDIVKSLSSVKGTQVGFPVSKRAGGSGLVRCFRFGSVELGWSNSGPGGIIFSANRNILLHGVYLFGSKGNNYSVNLTIEQLPSYNTVVSRNGTFSSLLHKSKKYWGFDVLLESPASLIKGKKYYIEAHIRGPKSFGGRQGAMLIESSGALFHFENSEDCGSEGTEVERGQLPEFIFSVQE